MIFDGTTTSAYGSILISATHAECNCFYCYAEYHNPLCHSASLLCTLMVSVGMLSVMIFSAMVPAYVQLLC